MENAMISLPGLGTASFDTPSFRDAASGKDAFTTALDSLRIAQSIDRMGNTRMPAYNGLTEADADDLANSLARNAPNGSSTLILRNTMSETYSVDGPFGRETNFDDLLGTYPSYFEPVRFIENDKLPEGVYEI
jgi:hypothetical protein